jgi:hypothetical protein
MGEHKHNPNVGRIPLQAIQTKQQPQFDLSQAVKKACPCGHEFFNKVFRIGIISKLAPGNKLNQDITVEYPSYVCQSCGVEFGKTPVVIQ